MLWRPPPTWCSPSTTAAINCQLGKSSRFQNKSENIFHSFFFPTIHILLNLTTPPTLPFWIIHLTTIKYLNSWPLNTLIFISYHSGFLHQSFLHSYFFQSKIRVLVSQRVPFQTTFLWKASSPFTHNSLERLNSLIHNRNIFLFRPYSMSQTIFSPFTHNSLEQLNSLIHNINFFLFRPYSMS